MLGIKIKKTLAIIPSYFLKISLEKGYSTITNEGKIVSGNDMVRAIQAATYNKLPNNKELISIIPVSFSLDEKEGIKDPKGMVGDKLGVSSIMISSPKKNVHSIVGAIEAAGVTVVDTIPSAICDYYEYKDVSMAGSAGAIVNVGGQTTTVSLFNKGVLTGVEVIQIGGDSIENDLSYIYKISKDEANRVKHHFALATPKNANSNDHFKLLDKSKKNLEINQYEISEVVSARISEIIKLSKKQVNLLTKREISYIIFTGGTTELPDFQLAIDTELENGKIKKIKTVGIRSNEYSVASGALKYFNEKLILRGKDFSMLTEEMQRDLVSSKKRILNFSEDSVLGKVFGYFFEN